MTGRTRRFLTLLLTLTPFAFSGCPTTSLISGLIGDCGDLSFSDVQHQNSISQKCRDAVSSLLPQAQNNFTSRMVVLGSGRDSSNRPILFLQGISASGTGLTSNDFTNGTITVTQGGTDTTLNPSEFTASPLSGETDGVASLSLVTDYSASMGSSDIDAAADIFDDFIAVIPTIILETEVSVFSDTVTVRRPFSEDRTAVLQAIARDDSIQRNSTALYDGMGQALDSLIGRSRPIRILVVATDGLENASETFTKAQVIARINDHRILTVMIGTLFSDVTELKDLAGNLGVFFYAQTYSDAQNQMQAFLSSLQNATKITLDAAYQNAESVTIQAQGLSLTSPL